MRRVHNIAKGAAMMTDTTVTIDEKAHYQSFHTNAVLDNLVLECLKKHTQITYTEEELTYAARFASGSKNTHPINITPDYNQHKTPVISTD